MDNKFRFLEPYVQRNETRFYLSGVGLGEDMNASLINRPNGTWDWLIMYYHTPVIIEVNSQKKLYKENTLMIWDETQSHYYGHPENDFQHSWIHCSGSIIRDYLKEVKLDNGVYENIDLNNELNKYLPLIYEERLRSDKDIVIIEGFFKCLIREMGRAIHPVSRMLPERMHKVIQYIEINYSEPIQLDDLCKVASLSKPHLIVEFKKYLEVSPIDYLIRIRLEHASSLLMNKSLSISEIAYLVGYNDIYHFSKIFKKHKGKSPSAYR